MDKKLQHLLELLALVPKSPLLFEGKSEDLGLAQVFGGQVIGQSLSAAIKTIDPSRGLHSFHSYFLRPGDPKQSILYDVEIIRHGKSFSTRRVKAMQNDIPIFYLTASYPLPEDGLNHQSEMPNIAGPEGILSDSALIQSLADKLPKIVIKHFGEEKPIESRPVYLNNPLSPQKLPAKQAIWIKANGTLPNDFRTHQYLLGYASDWNFLPTALHPHGISMLTPQLKMATIDHSMWFHRKFDLNDWLLFVIDSPSAQNARGFVRGEFYNQKGELVASVAQEGLIRIS